MKLHKELLTADTDNLKTEWKEEEKIPLEHKHHVEDIVYMIFEFEHMCNRYLGLIRAVRHRSELTSDKVRPVHSETYREGPTTLKLEKAEVEKMLKMNFIEPAQT